MVMILVGSLVLFLFVLLLYYMLHLHFTHVNTLYNCQLITMMLLPEFTVAYPGRRPLLQGGGTVRPCQGGGRIWAHRGGGRFYPKIVG